MGIVAIETRLRAGETLHSLTLRRVRVPPELNFGGEPDDAGFVSSLLGNHPDYQLTLLPQDAENASIITLDLTGPGPVAGCREVVNAMRKDARVLSVEGSPDAASTAPPVRSRLGFAITKSPGNERTTCALRQPASRPTATS